jgi:putative component of toxin-antitoxin plasmid stabilization module
MKTDWRFAGLKTVKGNVLKDFLIRDLRVQTRVEAFLRRLKTLQFPWPPSYYENLGDGVGELRVDYRNVEYRFYGFFGPAQRQFTVIMASDVKKRQQKTIQAAKQLKKSLDQGTYQVEDYDV